MSGVVGVTCTMAGMGLVSGRLLGHGVAGMGVVSGWLLGHGMSSMALRSAGHGMHVLMRHWMSHVGTVLTLIFGLRVVL